MALSVNRTGSVIRIPVASDTAARIGRQFYGGGEIAWGRFAENALRRTAERWAGNSITC